MSGEARNGEASSGGGRPVVDDGFHVFVYGLLRGGPEALMEGCRRVSQASVRGTLYDLGDFPALLLVGDDPVPGEIWWCPAHRLAVMDAFEGVDRGLFRRTAARIADRTCWIYVAGPALAPRLTS